MWKFDCLTSSDGIFQICKEMFWEILSRMEKKTLLVDSMFLIETKINSAHVFKCANLAQRQIVENQ